MRINRSIALLLAGIVAAGGCAHMKDKEEGKEVDIPISQMSAPARATIEQQTRGGTVEKVTKENERHREVYDVEATVGGKHMEYLVAADTGELLGTEVPVEYSEVPAPVRAAAEKHFGTSTGLSAMKGVEYGETHYEIEGMKNGKKAEASYDPQGKPED